jgi:hypothetical protein
MVKIMSQPQAEAATMGGDKGTFTGWRELSCPSCGAQVFVPSWPDPNQPSENTVKASALLGERNGCPTCQPDADWEI